MQSWKSFFDTVEECSSCIVIHIVVFPYDLIYDAIGYEYTKVIKEQRETESAEEELDRIKTERRKAERELERLRRILEGDQKKKKTEEPPPSE